MKHIFSIIFFVIIGFHTAFAASVNFNHAPLVTEAPARKPAFVFDDVPLMPALHLMDSESAEAFLIVKQRNAILTEGSIDVDSVYYFYQDQLPPLGWKSINAHAYEKGANRLDIQAKSSNDSGRTIVTFVRSH